MTSKGPFQLCVFLIPCVHRLEECSAEKLLVLSIHVPLFSFFSLLLAHTSLNCSEPFALWCWSLRSFWDSYLICQHIDKWKLKVKRHGWTEPNSQFTEKSQFICRIIFGLWCCLSFLLLSVCLLFKYLPGTSLLAQLFIALLLYRSIPF